MSGERGVKLDRSAVSGWFPGDQFELDALDHAAVGGLVLPGESFETAARLLPGSGHDALAGELFAFGFEAQADARVEALHHRVVVEQTTGVVLVHRLVHGKGVGGADSPVNIEPSKAPSPDLDAWPELARPPGMERAYRYYVIERGEEHHVYATAWPMRRADAERALLRRLEREADADEPLCLSAGSSEIAPQGAAVIMLDDLGAPHVALAADADTARSYLAEMGIDAEDGVIVPVELLRTPRVPRFSPELLAELVALRDAAGATRAPASDGAWCPSCGDARLGSAQTRCDACTRIDALLMPPGERGLDA